MPEDRKGFPELPAHTIRLAGPWECEPQLPLIWQHESGKADATPRRVKFPTTWESLFGFQGGTVRLQRRFNSPTGIRNQRLAIACQHARATGELRLNGELLGPLPADRDSVRYELPALQPGANLLELTLHHTPTTTASAHSLGHPISLEIYE